MMKKILLVFCVFFVSMIHAGEQLIVLSLPYLPTELIDACLMGMLGLRPYHIKSEDFMNLVDQSEENPILPTRKRGGYVHISGPFDERLYDYLAKQEIKVLFFVAHPGDIALWILNRLNKGLPCYHFCFKGEGATPEENWFDHSESKRVFRIVVHYLAKTLYRQEEYLRLPHVCLVRLEDLIHSYGEQPFVQSLKNFCGTWAIKGGEEYLLYFGKYPVNRHLRQELHVGSWKRRLNYSHKHLLNLGYQNFMENFGYNTDCSPLK